jgi:hypothetical protein
MTQKSMPDVEKLKALIDTWILFKKWKEEGDQVSHLIAGLEFYASQWTEHKDTKKLLEEVAKDVCPKD